MRLPLFWKVYLTLLASLILVTLAVLVLVRVAGEREGAALGERRAAFVEEMLPADADRRDLARVARALDADITIFAADGTELARSRRPPAKAGQRPGRELRLTLSDGRQVSARLRRPPPVPHSPIPAIALVAAVIGLAAYPVMRHATRRLERLRTAVDRWGRDGPSARVQVEGDDEVARLADRFNAAAERIDALLAAHRALLANASHELRSPLARLRLAAELHADAPSADRRAAMLTSIAELDQLVDEILLSSRLAQPDPVLRLEPVELLALLAEEAAATEAVVSGSEVAIDGDPRLLRRLIRNLLVNARLHGAEPIVATVEPAAGGAELRVRDHGVGIPAEERERVFEPFHRPTGHGETAGGWGLGLALVRQIAILHGGRTWVETPPGGGTCFIVRLYDVALAGAG